jgi:hypothetical protein
VTADEKALWDRRKQRRISEKKCSGSNLLPQMLIVNRLAGRRGETVSERHPHNGGCGFVGRGEENLHNESDDTGQVWGVARNVGRNGAGAHGGEFDAAQRGVALEHLRGTAQPRHDQQFATAHAREWSRQAEGSVELTASTGRTRWRWCRGGATSGLAARHRFQKALPSGEPLTIQAQTEELWRLQTDARRGRRWRRR